MLISPCKQINSLLLFTWKQHEIAVYNILQQSRNSKNNVNSLEYFYDTVVHMSMHFSASTPLPTQMPLPVWGRGKWGKGCTGLGGDVSAPSFLNCEASGQTLNSSTFLAHISPHWHTQLSQVLSPFKLKALRKRQKQAPRAEPINSCPLPMQLPKQFSFQCGAASRPRPRRVSVLHTGPCWCSTGHNTAFHLLFCSWTSI